MAGYLVERYLPGLTPADVHAAIRRMTAVAEEMAAEGIPIRYVTSAFIPEEDACFCQFEAPSREAVAAASERAAFPYARILAVDLASGDEPAEARARRLRREDRRVAEQKDVISHEVPHQEIRMAAGAANAWFP